MRPLLREHLKSLYVDPEIHRHVAVLAKYEGKPIREIVEEALITHLALKPLPTAPVLRSDPAAAAPSG